MGAQNKIPGVFIKESITSFLHGRPPIWISESTMGFWRQSACMVESRKVKSMLPMCSQWHAGSLHEPQKQHHTEVEQEAAVQSGLTARVRKLQSRCAASRGLNTFCSQRFSHIMFYKQLNLLCGLKFSILKQKFHHFFYLDLFR